MRLKYLKLPSLLVLLLSLNLGSCASKSGAKKQAGAENPRIDKSKQNILFICIDDLRPMINSYGETKMITPNMDKLASQGLQFNNAFTNVAVCGASRASVMTGIRPSQTRFTDYTSKASVDAKSAIPLNQIFKNNGYETISYGKVYHFVDDNKEYWTEIDNGHIQTDYQDPVSIASKNAPETIKQGRYGPAFEYPDVDDYAYNDGKITQKAIEKMKELKKDLNYRISKDGVHPGDQGHWIMAKEILRYLGGKKLGRFQSVEEMFEPMKDSKVFFDLIVQRQNILKDAWLTKIGHKRPEMKTGLPMHEANLKAADLMKKIKELTP